MISHIKDALERGEQLKRQRKLRENEEKERKKKNDTRRHFIVGRLVAQSFPGISHFQPKLSQADSNVEFMELERFFSEVANDPKYAALFQEVIQLKLSQESN